MCYFWLMTVLGFGGLLDSESYMPSGVSLKVVDLIGCIRVCVRFSDHARGCMCVLACIMVCLCACRQNYTVNLLSFRFGAETVCWICTGCVCLCLCVRVCMLTFDLSLL